MPPCYSLRHPARALRAACPLAACAPQAPAAVRPLGHRIGRCHALDVAPPPVPSLPVPTVGPMSRLWPPRSPGGPRARQRAYHARPCPPVGRGEPRYPARPRSPGQGPTSGTHAAWKRLGWIPGSRGSGRVREFFDEARLKPMSSR
jgi:hypothetical protein